jgi:hypothetical protein
MWTFNHYYYAPLFCLQIPFRSPHSHRGGVWATVFWPQWGGSLGLWWRDTVEKVDPVNAGWETLGGRVSDALQWSNFDKGIMFTPCWSWAAVNSLNRKIEAGDQLWNVNFAALEWDRRQLRSAFQLICPGLSGSIGSKVAVDIRSLSLLSGSGYASSFVKASCVFATRSFHSRLHSQNVLIHKRSHWFLWPLWIKIEDWLDVL